MPTSRPSGPDLKPLRHRVARAAAAAALVTLALVAHPAHAQAPAAAEPGPPFAVSNSALDPPLFYQLLISELEAAQGRADNAVELLLDAARRTGDEAVFRRATEVAIQARSGDQALAATRAWRTADPASREAVQWHLQVLFALGRVTDTAEPLRTLVELTPEADRGGLLSAVPRLYQSAPDKRQALGVVAQALAPYLESPATRVPAALTVASMAASAGDVDRAMALASGAHAEDPSAPGPVLVALELMPVVPTAEALVQNYLAQPTAEPVVRLAYARALTSAQRLGDASVQLRQVLAAKPDLAPVWLSLGAHLLELKQLDEAERALNKYLELAASQAATQSPTPAAAQGSQPALSAEQAVEAAARAAAGEDPQADAVEPVQAWLLLAEVAQARGDLATARSWLDRITGSNVDLRVLSRQASLMAREGRVSQARELLRQSPEREPGDARAKLLAEAQLLREIGRWRDARDVLAAASVKFPDDAGLLYEQAMAEEKLNRPDAMEALLRRVISIEPTHAHAHNALGYSLADRKLRLEEARALVLRALELTPGDPFIGDSLGWVEYRLGNLDEAARLLRQAHEARPDPEIAAHLGEVLWVSGRRDEARSVWREATGRDAANPVLRETLARLKVDL